MFSSMNAPVKRPTSAELQKLAVEMGARPKNIQSWSYRFAPESGSLHTAHILPQRLMFAACSPSVFALQWPTTCPPSTLSMISYAA